MTQAHAALFEAMHDADGDVESLGGESQWMLLTQAEQQEEQPSAESLKEELHSAGIVKVKK